MDTPRVKSEARENLVFIRARMSYLLGKRKEIWANGTPYLGRTRWIEDELDELWENARVQMAALEE